MGISLERQIVLVISLNLMFVLLAQMYTQIGTTSTTVIDNENNILYQGGQNIQDGQTANALSSNLQVGEQTAGNSLKMSSSFVTVFWRGLWGIPLTGNENEVEANVGRILSWGLLLINGIVLFEGFLIWKNRKV